VTTNTAEQWLRLALALAAQCKHHLALSLSQGGRGLQSCFDKLSTGLLGWAKPEQLRQ
jgi:hypothetical protein